MTAFRELVRRPGRRGWWRDGAGVAAVEFSLILPVVLLILGLVVYGGQIFRVQRKVTLGAKTVADLVSQGNNNSSATITAAELTQILAYPNLILYPYDAAAVQVVVSELSLVTNRDGTVTGTVVWSCPNGNANARPQNQQMSVDPDIAQAFENPSNNPAGYVILGEVYYPFQPYGLYYALSAVTLHDSIIMIPRTNAQITLQSPPVNCS